jgi:hypothetical protein
MTWFETVILSTGITIVGHSFLRYTSKLLFEPKTSPINWNKQGQWSEAEIAKNTQTSEELNKENSIRDRNRFILITLMGALEIAFSVWSPHQRSIKYGFGAAGVIALIDSHWSYWARIHYLHRVVTLGSSLALLVWLSTYLGA